MKNCIILLCILSFQVLCTKIQYTGELPNNESKDDMWHPHLKRNWINEKEFEIIDIDKNKYPAFLQVTKNQNTFLSENKKKLQCSCKFVKDEETPSNRVASTVNINKPQKSDIVSLIKRNIDTIPESLVKDEINNIAETDLLKNAEGLRLKEKNKFEIKTPIEHSSNAYTKKIKKFVKNPETFDSLTSENSNDYSINPSRLEMTNPNKPSYPSNNFVPDLNGIMNYMQMNSAIMNNIQNMLLNYQRSSNNMQIPTQNSFYRPFYPFSNGYDFNNLAFTPNIPNTGMNNLFRNNNMIENKEEDVYNLANNLFSKNVIDKKMKDENLNFFNR